MNELSVDARQLGEITVLYPRGYVNAHTTRILEGALRNAIDAGRYRIVVSGAGLAYIASAGLGALLGVIEELRGNGGDLRLADLNATVVNIFERMGFHHLYRIYPSELEAIASFADEPTEASK
jgi:anti-sigma B factor antagonist